MLTTSASHGKRKAKEEGDIKMEFKGNLIIRGVLKAKTGLHIGAQAAGIEIGKTDNPIVKQVNENGELIPYIPGSSLKGKIRSLLEVEASGGDPNFFNIKVQGKPGRHECDLKFLSSRIEKEIGSDRVDFKEGEKKILVDNGRVEISKEGVLGKDTDTYEEIKEVLDEYYPACDICTVFGRGAENKGEEYPTRTIFRDAMIDENSLRGNDLVEIKWENTVSRVTSEAMPRDMERVTRGAEFPFEVIYKIYDEDLDGGEIKEEMKLEEFPEKLRRRIKLIYKGFSLLEDDYLGGSGTRGYGKVEFKPFDIELRKSDYYEGKGTNRKIIANKSLRGILEIL